MTALKELLEQVRQVASCVSQLRSWAYATKYGYAGQEILSIIRSFDLDRFPNEDPPLPAERMFDQSLFQRGSEKSIERAKDLGEAFTEAVVLLRHLQQPADSPEEFEWHQENQPVFNSHVRDVVMGLTGRELPEGWLEGEDDA